MTPKLKSIELVNRYLQIYDGRVEQAKQCVIITVDEVLKAAFYSKAEIYDFYIEVKLEIEKI